MKNKLLAIGFSIAVSFAGVSSHAVELLMTSPGGEIGKTSTGTLLPATFNFTLGSFGAFVPTSLNLSSWAANFTAVQIAPTATWDDTFGISISATLNSNAGAFTTNNQAYLWGYNTQSLTPGVTEWVLFKNNTWLFPASSTPDPLLWDISNVGTVAVIGSLGSIGADPYIQTALVAPSAVPEPATYAAVFGLLAVGLVAYRRRVAA